MATPLVNGINYSWSNVKFNLFGVPVVGITEVNYNRKQAKDNQYGAGKEPVSRGYGNVEYDCDITLFLDEWRRIIAAAPSKDPLLISPFQIQVLFGDTSLSFRQDNLEACEFLEDPFNAKQGDSKILIKIPLVIAGVTHVQ